MFSLIVALYLTKTENRTKKYLTLLLWVKVLFLVIFCKKNADIRKVKRALVLKGKFSETTYVCTYQENLEFLA